MAKELPPFDPAKTAQFLMRHGHSAKLGLIFRDHGTDWVELELPWREDLVGEVERKILASGPIISMLDMASGLSIWTRHGTFAPVATLDLRVDYQRPARERSSVFGRVECYKLSKSAAFVRGVAHDGDPDDTVATMAGIFMTIGQDSRNA
ncbi:PaaI family thioesterase [Pontixanthobacter aestiaquae]|uniref:Phenylacetic acid degradation protein n=1 Tax=Pontixanthobacter aestiaquae TaxID=1509367 RepID=A0A844Z7V4_9SPHN|nr:PaaI family thioesterase [Pontixanthobacter aestiaquae]MDN3645849.1 PaaI family thioesterase [Pontixanthobacter aestiaquae]MXO83157.1 phenylacetic acid degradation protein [Pontixanthobacter aestiaquae]